MSSGRHVVSAPLSTNMLRSRLWLSSRALNKRTGTTGRRVGLEMVDAEYGYVLEKVMVRGIRKRM